MGLSKKVGRENVLSGLENYQVGKSGAREEDDGRSTSGETVKAQGGT